MKTEIEYLPSAYLLCCEKGHDVQLFKYGGLDCTNYVEELLCTHCGLTPEQIQMLTIGDDIPKAWVEAQK